MDSGLSRCLMGSQRDVLSGILAVLILCTMVSSGLRATFR
jgi:hypothetical protein